MTEDKTAPEVPHAGLIETLRERADWSYLTDPDEAQELMREAADALAALGDTVPREQHDNVLRADRQASNRVHLVMSERVRTATRERDEARAERDSLAHVIEQVREFSALVTGVPGFQRRLDAILAAVPAVSLALHDAEVFDQGWNACQQLAHNQEEFKQVHCDNPYRASASSEEAK